MYKSIKILRNILIVIVVALFSSCSGKTLKSLTLLSTTDIHGTILPYDFIEKRKTKGSLAACQTYINEVRQQSEVILLDNGDNLQGQPAVYYYNFIDTASVHLLASAFNMMNYDAVSVGNHDIEAGHSVYDRIANQYQFPMLAANAVYKKSGEPYFKPYTIINRNGLKVAILGMVTPAIPTWLPEELYKGMEFLDMVETARKWMPVIKAEHPDLIVGLFHSGWDRSEIKIVPGNTMENGSAAVAYNVPGFDVIFNGHDHRLANEKFVNIEGDTVLILNAGSHAGSIARADVVVSGKKTDGRNTVTSKGYLIEMDDFSSDMRFTSALEKQNRTVSEYVERVIGNSESDISSRDAYFGPSSFMELIHSIQLKVTGADLSFAAPLSFDVKIAKGPVTVSDMFKLYRFENMLYTMSLSGDEIKKYLEYSYGGWFNTVDGTSTSLIRFRTDGKGAVTLNKGKAWLQNQPYNFDSASGIDYVVDVSKPEGQRITIKGFSDGRPFSADKKYKVAINSYRGNGGGGHLTEGLGLDASALHSRILSSTDRDLRFYMLNYIENKGLLNTSKADNWKIIPGDVVDRHAATDYKLLFGEPR